VTGIEHHRWKRKNQPVWAKLKGSQIINANTTIDAAMSNIDAEYEALCASVLVTV
jgi:hypothetical protein